MGEEKEALVFPSSSFHLWCDMRLRRWLNLRWKKCFWQQRFTLRISPTPSQRQNRRHQMCDTIIDRLPASASGEQEFWARASEARSGLVSRAVPRSAGIWVFRRLVNFWAAVYSSMILSLISPDCLLTLDVQHSSMASASFGGEVTIKHSVNS